MTQKERLAPPQSQPTGNTTNADNSTAFARELHSRRTAALRLPRWCETCGTRDPWTCRCAEPPVSDQAVDGWVAASEYLLRHGLTPRVPLDVRRAMWRRPADRALAERLAG